MTIGEPTGYVVFLESEQLELLTFLVEEEVAVLTEHGDVTDPDLVGYLCDLTNVKDELAGAAELSGE